eukprot:jgi/Ulvmu1/12511/UM009_0166.1
MLCSLLLTACNLPTSPAAIVGLRGEAARLTAAADLEAQHGTGDSDWLRSQRKLLMPCYQCPCLCTHCCADTLSVYNGFCVQNGINVNCGM